MSLYQFFSILFAAIFLIGLTQLFFMKKSLRRILLNLWRIMTIIGISGLFFLICIKDIPLAFSLIGVLIALVLPVFIERISRPSLQIVKIISEPANWFSNNTLVETYWSIKVEVIHPKLPEGIYRLWADKWLERRVASRCRGTIQFIAENKSNDFPPMDVRWADSPQPTSPQAYISIGGQKGYITQFVKEVDIAPGDSNKIDIVVQFEGDPHCYGWNNESYAYIPENKAPRNPKWKLPPGQYRVELQIFYSDKVLYKMYRLLNSGTKDDLRMEPTSD
jgi:hypothetical protein